MTWAIKADWKFEAIEVAKETDKMVFYTGWHGREQRSHKTSFLDWRGDEDTAHALVAKLTSALSEYERRKRSAHDWYVARRAEILASADTRPEGGDAQQAPFTSGAVPEGQTPNPSSQSHTERKRA